ncbi:MAG: guanitoxin biosynthesis L-arginine gamma (S) hydroxylase [Paracoccaceae bacterium]
MQKHQEVAPSFEIYRFSKPLRTELKPLLTLDNWHGPLAVATDWFVIASAVVLAEFSFWFLPLGILLIGSRQRALASLLHEGAHLVLARARWLNQTLSEWLTGYVIFQVYDTYRTSHVEGHHKHLGDPHLDPDLGHYIVCGLYEVRDRHDFFWKHFVRTVVFLNIPQYLRYLLVHRLGDIWSSRRAFIRLLLTQLTLFSVFSVTVGWHGYFLYWLLPFLTAFQVIGWLSEISEHYDLFSKSQSTLTISRNRFPCLLERAFIGMHGDDFHQTHHLFPLIPFWNLKKAHQVLMQDQNYAAHSAGVGGILWASKGRRSVLTMIMEDIYRAAPAETSHIVTERRSTELVGGLK